MTSIEPILAELNQCNVLFSPIVELTTASILGYECFIPEMIDGKACHMAGVDINDLDDKSIVQIDRYQISRVFESIQYYHLSSHIFLRVNAINQIERHKKIIKTLTGLLESYGLYKENFIVKIHSDFVDLPFDEMMATALAYRQAGFNIALDFTSTDPNYLRLSSELRPNFLFIGRDVYQDVHLHLHEGRLLENMVIMSQQQQMVVVADGVTEINELLYLHGIGVNYAQGVLIDPPRKKPSLDVKQDSEWLVALNSQRSTKKEVALDLCLPVPAVDGDERLDKVVNRFLEDDDLIAVTVTTKKGKVLGLAPRQRIMDVFASNFGRSLHAKKKVDNFVSQAIVVAQDMPIAEISKLITQQTQAELQGIYVVVDGDERYLGVGLFVDLLRAITDQSVNKEFERLLTVIQTQSESKQKELEVLVESRTSELKEAMENLRLAQEDLVQSEKMAALGQLVAGVAHEVNTPLGLAYTLITHLSERRDIIENKLVTGALKKTDFQEFIDSAKETLSVSESNLQKAAKLIQSFKQVAVDQSIDEKRQISLYGLCDEILVSTRHVLKKSNHEVIIEVPQDIVIHTYAGALSQVLSNLVLNANIHAFDGMRGGKIWIRAEQNESQVCVSVVDNGKGIPVDIQKKIFDPFFTTKRGSGGSGLGLNIVFNLVAHKLNGKIECISQEGEGATFRFCIAKNIA